MNEKKLKETRVDYLCSMLGKTAHLTLEHFYLGSNYKALMSFHCDECYSCGVGDKNDADAWTFDWSKCVHPSSPGN
jgi:hypothetical protein